MANPSWIIVDTLALLISAAVLPLFKLSAEYRSLLAWRRLSFTMMVVSFVITCAINLGSDLVGHHTAQAVLNAGTIFFTGTTVGIAVIHVILGRAPSQQTRP
jgi:hypothetical protein